MPETDRLSRDTEWTDWGFVERERTPREIIEKGIKHHLAGLSLSNTVVLLEDLGVKRSRTAIHDWVQKADLQPDSDVDPNQIAVDETVVRVNGQRHWLYAAVDPKQINSPKFSCFRPEQRNSLCCFFANFGRNSRSRMSRFSLTMPLTSKRYSIDSSSDFACAVAETGTPSNISFIR
jgi:hypothetical protein